MDFGLRTPAGELWGSQKEDGSWTGMMGKLDRGEANIGIANLYVSISRVGVLDFSAAYDMIEVFVTPELISLSDETPE